MSDFESILNEPDDEQAETTTTETASETPEAVVASGTPVEAAGTREEPAPAGGTDAPAPPALPDGYKVDTLGRVHGPDGRVVGKDDAAKLLATVTPPPAPEVPAEPVAPPPEPEPYWVRHAGQKVAIPHAVRNADGSLTVKPEGEAVVRDLFTQALAHRQSWPQEKQRYEERLKTAETMAEAKSQKYNKASVVLFDKLDRAPEWFFSRIQDEGLRSALVAEWTREADYMRKEIALMLREADMQIPKEPTAPAPPDGAQLQEAAKAVLSEELEDLLETPAAKSLFGASERKELSETMLALMPAFFTEHQGEIVLDRHALKRAFDREVATQQRIRGTALKATQDAQKAKEAAAFNAAQQSKVSPALATRPTGTPALTAAAPAKRGRDWFDSAWNAVDDD